MNSPSTHDELEGIQCAADQKGDRAGAPPGNSSGSVKRQSVTLQPMSGLSGLVDFDSDLEDSDEDEPPRPQAGGGLPGQPMPQGFPGGPRGPPGAAPGAAPGPNHRPMVGGFAAAAYEAARAYHYQHQIRKPTNIPKRTGPPPSI